MKRLLIIVMMLSLTGSIFAAQTTNVKPRKNLPQGTFKKAWNGSIVQYDKNGKKIGTYKRINGKYQQVR